MVGFSIIVMAGGLIYHDEICDLRMIRKYIPFFVGFALSLIYLGGVEGASQACDITRSFGGSYG